MRDLAAMCAYGDWLTTSQSHTGAAALRQGRASPSPRECPGKLSWCSRREAPNIRGSWPKFGPVQALRTLFSNFEQYITGNFSATGQNGLTENVHMAASFFWRYIAPCLDEKSINPSS
jgi:hypothetical protein